MVIFALVISILFLVFSITFLKMHPFVALIVAAILAGLLSPVPLTAEKETRQQTAEALQLLERSRERLAISEQEYQQRRQEIPWQVQAQWQKERGENPGQAKLALELTAQEFGSTVAAIGIIIALAALIGQCLLESGAADKITRRMLALFGAGRASTALLGSGYFLSIPVFFDTVFFLLVPLARALRLRTGKDYARYVTAIAAGAIVTHSLVPPTPGPLLMVEVLEDLNLATAILLGSLLGLLPVAAGGILYARWIGRKLDIPLRETAGSSIEELNRIVGRSEEELPGLLASIAPVIVPLFLITADTVVQETSRSGWTAFSPWFLEWTGFLGDKNFALLVAAFLAAAVLMRAQRLTFAELWRRLEPALLSAGLIILITGAGGAFGKMLARTGITELLQQLSSTLGGQETAYILLAFLLASLMKIAQGSGTVAIITASTMMSSVLQNGVELGYHTIYIYAAVGFGSMVFSWMNDSGFWVVCKMSGFTERETLRTWSLSILIIGLAGLIEVLVLSRLLPLR